jgi:hypothetical protein
MRLFLQRVIVFSTFLICTVFFVAFLLMKNNPHVYQRLYKYQTQKIKSNQTFSNLFIGDSSLGNAIDSNEFSILSSQSTVNCALTGLYGYAGSYNILKTVHQFHPELKNVIIMQALDMQTRKVSMEGYVRTINSISDFTELEIEDKIDFLNKYMSYVRSLPFKFKVNQESIISKDYIKQVGNFNPNRVQHPYSKSDINPNKNKFLTKLKDYCSKHKLNLIYVHGPIFEDKLELSKEYIDSTNKLISSSGIKLIDSVIPIKRSQLGNTIDHINPKYKKDFTRAYFELVENYLIR